MKQPASIQYGTAEFNAIRAEINELLQKRAEVTAAIYKAADDQEKEKLLANFRALQADIYDLAAQVWVSYRNETAALLGIKFRVYE